VVGNASKWFCEDVGKTFGRGNVVDRDLPILDAFMNEMMADINMFDD